MMKIVFILTLILFGAGLTQAQSTEYDVKKGVALQGYDPVAYFTEHAAILGTAEFRHTWRGAEWHFKSQASLDAFRAAPEKYAPQYGGYCAYGVSEDHTSPVDPAAFTILDDKLYLNYSPAVKELWLKDTAGRIRKADANWPALKSKH